MPGKETDSKEETREKENYSRLRGRPSVTRTRTLHITARVFLGVSALKIQSVSWGGLDSPGTWHSEGVPAARPTPVRLLCPLPVRHPPLLLPGLAPRATHCPTPGSAVHFIPREGHLLQLCRTVGLRLPHPTDHQNSFPKVTSDGISTVASTLASSSAHITSWQLSALPASPCFLITPSCFLETWISSLSS